MRWWQRVLRLLGALVAALARAMTGFIVGFVAGGTVLDSSLYWQEGRQTEELGPLGEIVLWALVGAVTLTMVPPVIHRLAAGPAAPRRGIGYGVVAAFTITAIELAAGRMDLFEFVAWTPPRLLIGAAAGWLAGWVVHLARRHTTHAPVRRSLPH